MTSKRVRTITRLTGGAQMRPTTLHFRSAANLFLVLLIPVLIPVVASSQAPPSIQFFLPDGSMPPREIRFELAMDNGRVETFFTDSKGKFLLTRQLGLKPDAEYRVTVNGDGSTYDTTTFSFKEYGVYYIPIYLKP